MAERVEERELEHGSEMVEREEGEDGERRDSSQARTHLPTHTCLKDPMFAGEASNTAGSSGCSLADAALARLFHSVGPTYQSYTRTAANVSAEAATAALMAVRSV